MTRKLFNNYLGIVISVFIFMVMIIVLLSGLGAAKKMAQSEGLANTTQAIKRAIVECYALESAYPPNVEYIEENYGVQINREKYIVYYQASGMNTMPKVQVLAVVSVE